MGSAWSSGAQLLQWSRAHGPVLLGAGAISLSALYGALTMHEQVASLERDLQKERKLRQSEQQARELRRAEVRKELGLRHAEVRQEPELRQSEQQARELRREEAEKEHDEYIRMLVKSQMFEILHNANYAPAARQLAKLSKEAKDAAKQSGDDT